MIMFSFSVMSELLFECYHVPKLAFGVASLFSFYQNFPDSGNVEKMYNYVLLFFILYKVSISALHFFILLSVLSVTEL